MWARNKAKPNRILLSALFKANGYKLITKYLPTKKGGSAGRELYRERSKEVNLFQIYNMDSGNAMQLDSHVDPNESFFQRRQK